MITENVDLKFTEDGIDMLALQTPTKVSKPLDVVFLEEVEECIHEGRLRIERHCCKRGLSLRQRRLCSLHSCHSSFLFLYHRVVQLLSIEITEDNEVGSE